MVTLGADEQASFECSLDDGPYQPCTSPQAYFSLRGRHTHAVRAIDPAGNIDTTPAERSWNPSMVMSKQD